MEKVKKRSMASPDELVDSYFARLLDCTRVLPQATSQTNIYLSFIELLRDGRT